MLMASIFSVLFQGKETFCFRDLAETCGGLSGHSFSFDISKKACRSTASILKPVGNPWGLNKYRKSHGQFLSNPSCLYPAYSGK